jgi:hypothetical protein
LYFKLRVANTSFVAMIEIPNLQSYAASLFAIADSMIHDDMNVLVMEGVGAGEGVNQVGYVDIDGTTLDG